MGIRYMLCEVRALSAGPTSVNRDDSPAHRLCSDFAKARRLNQVNHGWPQGNFSIESPVRRIPKFGPGVKL